MAHPAGESESDAPRLNFDRRLKLELHGSSVTSDAGLLPFREPEDVLGLMVIAGQYLADGRTGTRRAPACTSQGLLLSIHDGKQIMQSFTRREINVFVRAAER